jgi:dUTP pyrophosphatase
MNSVILQLFKLHPDVPTPKYGTTMAACFDLSFHPCGRYSIQGYNNQNESIDSMVYNGSCYINPGDRLLVPTGLVARISGVGDDPAYYSIRIHARSGMSLRNGLILANSEGVVDVDYQKEIFVMLTNISNTTQRIDTGDRIAQAEIVKNYTAMFHVVDEQPKSYSERDGGFGSTGHS